MPDMPSQLQTLVPVCLAPTGDALVILDQTLLPNQEVYLTLDELPAIHEAIVSLRVRGAPAIGITAAYALYLAARQLHAPDYAALEKGFFSASQYLATARPTAVNLCWALSRMQKVLLANCAVSPEAAVNALRLEAERIQAEDRAVSQAIGENGLALLQPGFGLLTHCNAGSLAASHYGTALAPVYLGAQQGFSFKVYADETRPLLQGARLTAYELQRAGIDVTLICDSMAASVMQQGLVQAVLVGCDRVAANGDTANKIGTAGVAILARHFHIPFYVCAPLSTIDMACPDGRSIIIEERPEAEITEHWYRQRMAPPGVKVRNPAFDVTEHDLVSAFITEKGIVRPPFVSGFAGLF